MKLHKSKLIKQETPAMSGPNMELNQSNPNLPSAISTPPIQPLPHPVQLLEYHALFYLRNFEYSLITIIAWWAGPSLVPAYPLTNKAQLKS